MTETRAWLERRRFGFLVREGLAVGLVATGWLVLALALGVMLDRVGLYRRVPELALAGWILAAAAVAYGVISFWRRRRDASADGLAAELEARAGLRRGSVRGPAATGRVAGSSTLAALADRITATWLGQHGEEALRGARAVRGRAVRRGLTFAAFGLVAFAIAGPGTGVSAFWQPLEAIARARGPVVLEVDHTSVRRGDSVVVAVVAAGRLNATVHQRAPGERWRSTPLMLDTAGRASITLGPLESDRFIHATSDRRHSDTVRVRVLVPAFLSDLSLVASYPAYLERLDELLVPGPDTVLLPVGTRVMTRGRATRALREASWQRKGAAVSLEIDQLGFAGAFNVTRSAHWTLLLNTTEGVALEGSPPELVVRAVRDSAPLVTIPLPGADTTAPTTLRQPLIIDARDDHLVTQVEVVSRRVSRLGMSDQAVTDTIRLPDAGIEHAVLQWLLDLNDRGFLPGDTAYYLVRAYDNAPRQQVTATPEFILRLPSLTELREATRAEARALAAEADSLAHQQQELVRAAEDLAAERERPASSTSGVSPGGDQLRFQSAERAGEVANAQTEVLERAQRLRERLQELADAAWSAGLTDPEWHQQLADLQALLERAVTEDLRDALRALQEAMQQLDAPALREALERLAEAQEELRRELERSRTLFERAALEGEMTTLADEASELADRQREWSHAVERSADSALAQAERALAARADSLAVALADVERTAEEAGAPQSGEEPSTQARRASQRMQQAAQAASQGQQVQASQAGSEAAEDLDPIAESLRQQRDSLREEWRREVLESMDHALVETAQLARRQEEIQRRLQRGEAGAEVRSAQAAVRDGVDRVIERLQNAAGKNALVSTLLARELGFAKVKMSGALDLLQQANPNARGAGDEAGEALDGLNATAYQLLRSRSEVQSAATGSGLQEAIERLSQLAQQQNSMAGQANSLLSMMPGAGDMVMQELQALAQRQRALANELERLRAEGDRSGAGELADQARELARELEAGVLDRRMVERQEQLYRRLLDAGRTLRGNEEDEERERTSRTGRADNVLIPQARQGSSAGPRYPYPSWEQLQGLSPEERRLILDYFRRLNRARGN